MDEESAVIGLLLAIGFIIGIITISPYITITENDWQCVEWENHTNMPYACYINNECVKWAVYLGVTEAPLEIRHCSCEGMNCACAYDPYISYPQCQVCTQQESECIKEAIYRNVSECSCWKHAIIFMIPSHYKIEYANSEKKCNDVGGSWECR